MKIRLVFVFTPLFVASMMDVTMVDPEVGVPEMVPVFTSRIRPDGKAEPTNSANETPFPTTEIGFIEVMDKPSYKLTVDDAY